MKNDVLFLYGLMAVKSPIYSAISEIIMQYLEKLILNDIDYNLVFYYGYVDDINCCLPVDKIQNTSNRFNQINEYLKFTIRCGHENTVAPLAASWLDFRWLLVNCLH